MTTHELDVQIKDDGYKTGRLEEPELHQRQVVVDERAENLRGQLRSRLLRKVGLPSKAKTDAIGVQIVGQLRTCHGRVADFGTDICIRDHRQKTRVLLDQHCCEVLAQLGQR